MMMMMMMMMMMTIRLIIILNDDYKELNDSFSLLYSFKVCKFHDLKMNL